MAPWNFYNSSGEALTSFGPVALTDLDIDGGTAIGEAVVGADLFIADNGAGGTNVKVTATEVAAFIGANASGTAKAWGRLSGTDGSSTLDYNMDAATDNGTGDFTLNWTTNFSSVNYSAGGTTSPAIFVGQITDAPAAGTFRIGLYNTSGALADTSIMFLWAFGVR